MIIDVHAHYDDNAFSEDLNSCLERVKEAGIGYVINAAVDYETSVKSIELAKKFDNVL